MSCKKAEETRSIQFSGTHLIDGHKTFQTIHQRISWRWEGVKLCFYDYFDKYELFELCFKLLKCFINVV